MSTSSDLKPWFREDIARILLGVYFVNKASNPVTEETRQYRIGFTSAILSIALVIGINPSQIMTHDDLDIIRAA